MKNLKLILGICIVAVVLFFTSCAKESITTSNNTTNTEAETMTELTQSSQKSFHLEGYGEMEIDKEYALESIKGTSLYKFIKENAEKNATGYVFGAKRNSGTGCYAIRTPPYSSNGSGSLSCCNNSFNYQFMYPAYYPVTYEYRSSGIVALDLDPNNPDPNSNNAFTSGYAFIAQYANNSISIKGSHDVELDECRRAMRFYHKKNSNPNEYPSYFLVALIGIPCDESTS